MLGIGEFDPVDPGRRLAPGARDQPRQIEQDHAAPRKQMDKVPDTVLQRVKRLVEAGGAQFRHVGLREVLILVAQLGGSVDEPDIRRTSDRRADRIDEVEKASRGAGSDIEQTR